MTVQEALEQAREALHIVPLEHRTVALSSAMAALVKAVEEREPHMVDTRHLSEVVLLGREFSITRGESGAWTVVHADGDEICTFVTLSRAMEEVLGAERGKDQ